MRSLALCALVACCLAPTVAGHGYLAIPASRNFLANTDYCPQCLSAGGPAVVSGGAQFPAGQHGICGDPAAGPRRHEAGGSSWTGQPSVTWTEGEVVNVTATITAFHKGRLAVRVCRVQGTDAASEKAQLTEACLNQNVLRQAAVPGAQSPGDPFYHLGQTSTGNRYTWAVQLPAGLTCDGVTSKCVMQWHYLTGNSCDPPGEPAPWSSPQLPTCGPGAPYPEEFWNCADIRILPAGTPLPASPPPSPVPSPSPVPVPSPPIPDPTPGSPAPSGGGTTTDPCRSGDAACYCRWQARDGMFADVGANPPCSAWYHCMGTSAYYRACPTGLLFNDQQMYCDWKENVKCAAPAVAPSPPAIPSPSPSPPPTASSPPLPKLPSPPPPRPSPPPPRPSPPPPSPVVNPPPPPTGTAPAPAPPATFCATKAPATGFFRDPLSCRGYYRCEVSGAWFFQCQEGLAFNEAIRSCDWAANVPGCAPKTAGRRLRL